MRDGPTITRQERDALYEQILDHLSGIDDLRIAILREDFVKAARLSREIRDELDLIDNLGWGYGSRKKLVELTLPEDDLRRVSSRMRDSTKKLRASEEEDETDAERENQEWKDRARLIEGACERILSIIGGEQLTQ